MASHAHATAGSPNLPLLISIGFAGSRHLLDPALNPSPAAVQSFEDQLTLQLKDILTELPSSLGLPAAQERQHFFCGISQLAIGADQCFTRACQALEIPQRLFLPLPWDAYSRDISSKGKPDFTPTQKAAAAQLLHSPHIIQQRIISRTDDRGARFEDVNLEIVEASDVIISLVRAQATAKPGGTQHLIDLAIKRSRPVLEIIVTDQGGVPQLDSQWHVPGLQVPAKKLPYFRPPTLPHDLEKITLLPAHGQPPAIAAYTEQLKTFGSKESQKHSSFFKKAALIIIGTHLLATAAAVLAMKFNGTLVQIILGIELAFLATGYLIHHFLHTTHAVMHWAFCRLVAELARSVRAIGERQVYLEYLFSLPFPTSLRPILRTLNTLHLNSTRTQLQLPLKGWSQLRDIYISTRLEGKNGQLAFYKREANKAKTWLSRAQWAFTVSSLGAFFVSALKLWINCDCPTFLTHHAYSANSTCGFLAILLPVLAVGGLSLAAALDLEARAHTFEDMVIFLDGPQEKKKSWWQKLIAHLRRLLKIEKPPEAPSTAPIGQIPLLKEASSEREFDKLMLETESRLLGETVNWFSRRSFTGVA